MTRYELRANYRCPNCQRNTLAETPGEIVAYKCTVCDERVEEGGR